MGIAGPVLNVGFSQARSTVNGPGRRYALWLQGCPIHCRGCVNTELQPFTPKHLVPVEEMAGRIKSTVGIEGVSYTGGEPMCQARELALLSELVRPAGLSVVCFTGYRLEQLLASADPFVHRLLSSIDLLIDGPFVEAEAEPLCWRGSRNQRLLPLTDRYRGAVKAYVNGPAQVDFNIDRGGFVSTGIWPDGFIEQLELELRAGRTEL